MKQKLILMLLFALPAAHAMQIDMLYYNPVNEAGSEFVLLTNTGSSQVNLTGWTLATPASSTDATLTGVVNPGESFLVADAGFSTGKDDAAWPDADYEETLTLSNSDGFVQLYDDQATLIATVGYGNTDTYEGAPHPGAPEGQALVRTQTTGDNSQDFTNATPTFTLTPTSTDLEQTAHVNVTVQNYPPRILFASVTDDLPDSGVQLLPIPGATRQIDVAVDIEDLNGISEVSVTANGFPLTSNMSGPNGTFSGIIDLTTDTQNITITASDVGGDVTYIQDIELLDVIGIGLSNDIEAAIDPGSSSTSQLDIQNIGTAPMNIQVRGTRPQFAESILGDIQYTLLGQSFILEAAMRQHDLTLAPGDVAQMDLTINAGYVPAGSYIGQIVIAGVQA